MATKRTPELQDILIAGISNGTPLLQLCRENDISKSAVYDWMKVDEEFAGRFARAREEGFDAIAEEALEIIESVPERYTDQHGNRRIDPGAVQWAKNRLEGRLKLLAKWSPKKYGDKLELAGDKDAPLTVNIVRFCDDED